MNITVTDELLNELLLLGDCSLLAECRCQDVSRAVRKAAAKPCLEDKLWPEAGKLWTEAASIRRLSKGQLKMRRRSACDSEWRSETTRRLLRLSATGGDCTSFRFSRQTGDIDVPIVQLMAKYTRLPSRCLGVSVNLRRG